MQELVIEQIEKEEIRKAELVYTRHYKGKESRGEREVELALLELLGDLNAGIPGGIERELEKRGFILTKNGKRYFTQRGYEIATSIKEFNRDVLNN